MWLAPPTNGIDLRQHACHALREQLLLHEVGVGVESRADQWFFERRGSWSSDRLIGVEGGDQNWGSGGEVVGRVESKS